MTSARRRRIQDISREHKFFETFYKFCLFIDACFVVGAWFATQTTDDAAACMRKIVTPCIVISIFMKLFACIAGEVAVEGTIHDARWVEVEIVSITPSTESLRSLSYGSKVLLLENSADL
jgi:hypothetical protein